MSVELSEALTAIAVYAVCTVAFFPGLLLTLSFGAIYGAVEGGVLSLVGATLGAALATFIARRYLQTTMFARLLDQPNIDDDDDLPPRLRGLREFLRNLYGLVDQYGVRTVIITRLTPVVPFNVLNYLLGLTTLPIWQISLLSFVCMAPASFVYTWIGSSGANAVREGDPVYLLYILAGVAALLVIKPLSARLIARLKRGGQKRIGKS